MPHSKRSFESTIVSPILRLDASFITTQAKRRQVPLPTKGKNWSETNAAADANDDAGNQSSIADQYAERLRHCLLHETFQGIGKEYDERNAMFGKTEIELTVTTVKTASCDWWSLECRVPTETIDAITKRLKKARKLKETLARRGRQCQLNDEADFLLRELSIGIVEGERLSSPILGFIQSCTR